MPSAPAVEAQPPGPAKSSTDVLPPPDSTRDPNPTPPSDTSTWVRLFRGLGINWTKELDFVVLPAAIVLCLFVAELLNLSGYTWAGIALTPPVLLTLAIATILWALWAMHEQAGALGDRTTPSRNRGLHDAWRARTIAWDILVLGIASLGVVIISWAGPTRVIPPGDLAVVEIATLVVTVALLATFARYTAMAFSTDMDSLVKRLDDISQNELEQRTVETERLTASFEREVGKLVTRVDRQVTATEEGLKAVAGHLAMISTTLAAQAKLNKEIAQAQKDAAEAQRKAVEDATQREVERRRESEKAAAQRREKIRPTFKMRLDWAGMLFHRLTLSFQNEGGKAEGVRVEVSHSAGVASFPPIPAIASGETKPVELGDVAGYALSTVFAVTLTTRDVDGNRYSYQARATYSRTTGFWGQTKTIHIQPQGWTPMTSV